MRIAASSLIAIWSAVALVAGATSPRAQPAPEAPQVCPEPPDPVPPPEGGETPAEWRARIDNARERSRAFACRARQEWTRRVEERRRMRENAAGKLDEFLADDTLQRGDVVVTDEGFRVYNGSPEAPARRDFAPVETGRVRPNLRRELTDMEKASRPPTR